MKKGGGKEGKKEAAPKKDAKKDDAHEPALPPKSNISEW